MATPNGSHTNGNGSNGSAYHQHHSYNSQKTHSSNYVVEEKPKGYYTVERSFYAQPPDSGTTVVVEKEVKNFNIILLKEVFMLNHQTVEPQLWLKKR